MTRRTSPARPARCRRIARALTAAAFLAAATGSALSIDNRTIKIVLPVPPGGAGDIVARLLIEQVSRAQNRSLVLESRPGAGTMIGTEAVVRAPADGSTLLINAPFLLIAPHLRKLSFDPLSGLEPICYLVGSPGVISVSESSPYRTFAELVNAVRAKPGELSFASAGPGTTHHIGFEMLKRTGELDFIYVPFSGGGPAINAALGNHVTAILTEYAPVSEHLKSGKLRPLAATSKARIPSLPDVPTVAETYKNFEVDFWWALFAPANTPRATINQLAEWFISAMKVPELKAKLVALGFFPTGICGSDFATLLRRQSDDYGRTIAAANIKAD
jgi:tripartite-type tricarboxylate transporter receptor subunit TctC